MLNFTHMLGKGGKKKKKRKTTTGKNNYCEFKPQMNGTSLIHKCHMKLWFKKASLSFWGQQLLSH